MSNIATFARIQHSGDGSPDPRTATCQQHVVAAPYSDTAKGDGTSIPESLGWACTVCPLPDADLIGTPVIVAGHVGSTLIYGGPDGDRPAGYSRVSFSMRGGPHVVQAHVTSVAPADTVINLKDPRITVTKLPKKRDYSDAGPWLPAVDHPALTGLNPTAKKTKRDATEWAALRLAIADFHATRS